MVAEISKLYEDNAKLNEQNKALILANYSLKQTSQDLKKENERLSSIVRGHDKGYQISR